ncbi:hypothetical protein HN843_01030 [bacterium]|jgi:hypothetical protein|nr:hypothetical protein [bacterium]
MKMILVLLLVCTALISGCEQSDVKEFKAVVDAGSTLAENQFSCDVTFFRAVSKKSEKLLGVKDTFKVSSKKKNKYLRAAIDINNPILGETNQIHLSWIKPDGKEMFRKFGEVTMTKTDDGYTTSIVWLKAEDLHYSKVEDPIVSDDATFRLNTKLNISPEKERDPGSYAMRVYWNREFLFEKTVELVVAEKFMPKEEV